MVPTALNSWQKQRAGWKPAGCSSDWKDRWHSGKVF